MSDVDSLAPDRRASDRAAADKRISVYHSQFALGRWRWRNIDSTSTSGSCCTWAMVEARAGVPVRYTRVQQGEVSVLRSTRAFLR